MIPSRRKWLLRCTLVVVALAGVFLWRFAPRASTIRPDPADGWRIQFGRGSGMHGLDTVKIASDGYVVLHRLKRTKTEYQWERTSLTLPPDALANVFRSIEQNQLLAMEREYRPASIVCDGTQWVFWLRHNETTKSVYFDNEFPTAIERFAEELDSILVANGLATAAWEPVHDFERLHERELWDSIKRK